MHAHRPLFLLSAAALLIAPLPGRAWNPFKRKPASAPISAPSAPAQPSAGQVELTAQARQAYENGELKRAAALFEQAIDADRGNAAAEFNAGIFYVQIQQHDRAVRHLKRTLKLDPDHALAWYYLGLVAEKAGDPDRAIENYSQAARRNRRVLDPAYNKEVVQSKLTLDVRLRRYLEGDRPLDFAAVAAPAAAPPAPVAKPQPKPAPKPDLPKEIRIESKPSAPAPAESRPAAGRRGAGEGGDARRGGAQSGRPPREPVPGTQSSAGGSGGGQSGRPQGETDPDADPSGNQNREEEFPPLPPVNGPEWRLPDIDRP